MYVWFQGRSFGIKYPVGVFFTEEDYFCNYQHPLDKTNIFKKIEIEKKKHKKKKSPEKAQETHTDKEKYTFAQTGFH